MAQKTEEERKKGAVPIPFAGGAAAHPSLFVALLATGAGRIALVTLTAAVGCGLYGASLALAALNEPAAKPAVAAKMSAPSDPGLRKIDPQTSMNVVPVLAGDARVAEKTSDAAQALQAATENGTVPTVAAPADPSAIAAQAVAMATGQTAPAGAQPNHIAARRSALGRRLPGVDAAGVATDGGIASKLPSANGSAGAGNMAGGLQPAFQRAGQSRAFDKDRQVTKTAAAVGRAGAGHGRGAMRQLQGANNLSHGMGEAGSTHGAEAFDGGAAINETVAGAISGPTQAQQEAAAAKESDYGGDGAPLADTPHPSGAAAMPAAPEPEHKNATPWQKWVDMANMLTLSAGLLMISEYFLAKSPHTKWLAVPICYTAIAMGLIVIGLSAKIMAMGQTMQGLMFMIGGFVIAGLALKTLNDLTAPPVAKTAIDSQTSNITSSTNNALSEPQVGGPGHPSCLPPK